MGLPTHQNRTPNVLAGVVSGEEAISSLRDLRQSSPALSWDIKTSTYPSTVLDHLARKTPFLMCRPKTIDSFIDVAFASLTEKCSSELSCK